MEKNYDEKRVPSRGAEVFTHFGWVRARNKVSEELDRRAKGIRLTRRDDAQKTELIRRRKRFGYNSELVELEKKYLKYGDRKQKKGTVVFLRLIGIVCLLLFAVCLVLTFVPKIPKTVADLNAEKGIVKTITDISLSLSGSLFYGDQYYVKDSDVSKIAADEGTVVTIGEKLTVAYRLGEDGQLISSELDALKEKIKLDEDGNIPILRCQKAYLNPNDESTAYYRYYVFYDTEKAPLGFVNNITSSLPSIIASGFIAFAVVALVIAIVLFIIAARVAKTNRIIAHASEMLERAEAIVKQMQEEDPSLMGKAQRHFYSWQKLMAGAINQSNVAKNDNSGGDSFGEEFEI